LPDRRANRARAFSAWGDLGIVILLSVRRPVGDLIFRPYGSQ